MVFLLYNIHMALAYAPYKKIFANHNGILRASKAIELGVPKHVLYEMVKTGKLSARGRGYTA